MEGKPKSVMMVAHTHDGSYTLYELKIQPGGQVIGVFDGGSTSAATRNQLLDPVANLFKGVVLPEGCVFDIETKSLVPLKSPQSHKPSATVIPAYGKLYHLANRECESEIPTPAFELYDPATDCWESLPPFPEYCDKGNKNKYVTRKQWCFDATRKQWHEVSVWPAYADDYCYAYGSVGRGRAMVVGDTIYTFNYSCSNVVAFEFWRDLEEDGDVTFYVTQESILKGLKIIRPLEKEKNCYEEDNQETQGYLVHLGNLDFCLVQNFFQRNKHGRQEFCVTIFQVVGEGGGRHIKTLNSTICEVDTRDSNFLSLSYCFGPDVDDIELEEEDEKQQTENFSLFGTSDIPEDLKLNILARLSTKDLRRLMCVSKAWNAAILDPQLAKKYINLDPPFFICLLSWNLSNEVYPVALFYNDTGKYCDVSEIKHQSKEVQKRDTILGCCNGLLCITTSGSEDFGLWNPAIRKFKKIPLSSFSKFTQKKTFYGFGYDSVNHDYKYVRLAQFKDHGIVTISSEVQVYSLESHSWKRVQDLPAHLNKDYELASEGVCVDGALHWLMRLRGERGRPRQMIILTLNLTTEEYHWCSIPDYRCDCDDRKARHPAILQALLLMFSTPM